MFESVVVRCCCGTVNVIFYELWCWCVRRKDTRMLRKIRLKCMPDGYHKCLRQFPLKNAKRLWGWVLENIVLAKNETWHFVTSLKVVPLGMELCDFATSDFPIRVFTKIYCVVRILLCLIMIKHLHVWKCYFVVR